MPIKRLRFEHSLLDTKEIEKGEDYTKLPDIISLVYTTEPLKNHDTGETLCDLAVVDLRTNEIAPDYGIRMLIVNGKYKSQDDKEFSDIIEDLQKRHPADIKNPVIQDIHIKTKTTEKGRKMLSQFIEERYGDIIREYEEQHLKDQERLQKANEEIQKYKDLIKKNGIIED